MDIQEVLEFVDEVVLAKTGHHLNDLQRGIIEGTWEQQKYADIAKISHRGPGHVKDVAYKLLQLLSDAFDEPVHKNNIKSVLERQINLKITLGNNYHNNTNQIIGINNVECPSDHSARNNKKKHSNSDRQSKHNQAQQAIISKLRKIGLSDEQIADALGLTSESMEHLDS